MADKTVCPNCGKPKKPWFELCYECNEKEKQKPTCEVCGVKVPEGHYLCKKHWRERKEHEGKLKAIDKIKEKKTVEFKEKFEGKYYFNSQRVKSKSELLICYFLSANEIQFQYEPRMNLEGELRPDFVLNKDNNYVILEHFGLDDKKYVDKKNGKIKKYENLCSKKPNFSFVYTTEEDMRNLKDRLGKKLDGTPLKKVIWI